ncbi:hypothetical protein NE237_002294 [Protea cynaroides]|uniref:Uncharacterized protein n=1 Tax=Protea cynaroides TaxID=273540 RepID=A0A9Q0QYX6_9MAGN|nr:hypothetical protein NE237_002294 [Protea cynaroides]
MSSKQISISIFSNEAKATDDCSVTSLLSLTSDDKVYNDVNVRAVLTVMVVVADMEVDVRVAAYMDVDMRVVAVVAAIRSGSNPDLMALSSSGLGLRVSSMDSAMKDYEKTMVLGWYIWLNLRRKSILHTSRTTSGSENQKDPLLEEESAVRDKFGGGNGGDTGAWTTSALLFSFWVAHLYYVFISSTRPNTGMTVFPFIPKVHDYNISETFRRSKP